MFCAPMPWTSSSAIDTETTGLKWWEDRLFGISIAVPEFSGYWDVRTNPAVIDWLNDLIREQRVGIWTNHNIKFDYHFLREAGVVLPPDRLDCTMVRAALINEHEPTYALDFLAPRQRVCYYFECASLAECLEDAA